MKRILAALALALAAATSFGATQYPLSLMSTVGSTSGQVPISTGPSTPATWGNVSAVALTGIVPVLNGGTGVTTVAAEVTRLSAAVTTGTLAQFAATSSAQLLGVLSDETGTGVAVFGTSPTITTPNIVGVTSGSNATAGSVGEYVTATGTAVPLTTAVSTNCTSISLTAGDWDVWGNVAFTPNGSTVFVTGSAGINTTSATAPAAPFYSLSSGSTFTNGNAPTLIAPTVRETISATTTIFLVATSAFTTSTETATCYIAARRRR